jgi:2-methylcitrate dehydratase PrpD
MSGITAAALAQQGFVAATNVYEGRFGLYASHLQGRFKREDLALATAGLGERWELMNVAVKPFPACHFTHAFADAAIALRDKAKLDADAVREIRALVPAEVVTTVCEPAASKRRPGNAYDAQFSIPYVVASALRYGRFGLADLTDQAIADPQTLALAERVAYEIDPQSGFPRYFSGELVATTSDGRVLRHREAQNRGCSDRPLSEADILAKFRENCRGTVAEADTDRHAERILSLDKAIDMRGFGESLGAPR